MLPEEIPATASGETVLVWKSYQEDARVTSVPRYLEHHAERIRARYLAFVHDLGETRIAGRRLVDHFTIETGFSLWWMIRIPEKSPFKSPRIYDCLRLLALEEILLERKVSSLTLHTADADLMEAIGQLCSGLGVGFEPAPRSGPRRPWSLRRLYDALPHSVQGLLSLRHLALRWRFRRLRRPSFSGDRTIFMCSYFFALDQVAGARGQFHSHQWEMLPQWLIAKGLRINWLHHYLPDPGQPSVATAETWAEQFNRDAERQGRHAFLETYLSLKLTIAVVRRWLWLHLVGWRMASVRDAFRPTGSAASFWPLLRDDWWNSLHGTAAISNCVWVELFEAALRDLPHQSRGLYLYEGQGWECALIHAWRRHGHGRLLGVPHSSMPFWYLNIYDDPRCVAIDRSCDKPMPDALAINGMMAQRALTAAGYPAERLVGVEALRFQHLLASDATASARPRPAAVAAPAMLVLGDFTRKQTLKILRCLEVAARLVPGLGVTIKLHPACPVDRREAAALSCEFTTRPLAEIIGDFDFAFSSNSTSAAMDAWLAGLPVAVFLDDDNVNESPLRGETGVTFVSNGDELAAAIEAAGRAASRPPVEHFFWLNEQLPRWRKALSIPSVQQPS